MRIILCHLTLVTAFLVLIVTMHLYVCPLFIVYVPYWTRSSVRGRSVLVLSVWPVFSTMPVV